MLGEYLLVGYQDQEYVISDGCVGGVGPRTIILGIAKLAPQLREKSSRIRPPIQNSQPVHLNDGGSNKVKMVVLSSHYLSLCYCLGHFPGLNFVSSDTLV